MRSILPLFLLALTAVPVVAQGRKVQGPPPPRTVLPQDYPYQKQLRTFMGTLTEKDFTHGVKGALTHQPSSTDPDYQYRNYLLTLMGQPLVGTKRGVPAVNAPAALFVLSALEQPDGVHVPPVFPEPLTTFANWNYPGNPFYQNRALKLRAFVTAAVHLMMLDDLLENHPEASGSRSDWLGSQLVLMAQPYPGFKDQLPAEVQKAYAAGLRRMGQRILDWGPEGEEPNLEIVGALGLWYVSQAVQDPAFTKEAEAYARALCTDPRYFHPAGFFLDQRGMDIGYQGMTNFFSTGLALASDWPFARDAVRRCYRLKAHLVFPEPDDKYVGPSHFNSRTSSDAWGDQWEWGIARDSVAALVTEEAAFMTKFPNPEELAKAADARASAFNQQIGENPPTGKGGFMKNEDIRSGPWKWRLWQSFNFPATVNFGYEHFPAGSYARAAKLRETNSPWLRSPYLRDETFVRNFDNAFFSTRQKTYAALVHSGPVGQLSLDNGTYKFPGALGFGGGQLSAFWTPATGAVVLGRRGGNSWEKVFDVLDDWRQWPLHAVTGSKYDGKVFTSARICQPHVSVDPKDEATVLVSGVMPVEHLGQGKVLEGRIQLARKFHLGADRVAIETRVQSTGQDKLAELYETIPVFLSDASRQAKTVTTTIELQAKGQWAPATEDYQEQVTAVKLTRFSGAVRITFERPQRVKLSPAVWTDPFLSRAQCRNLMIDLLDGATAPLVWKGEKVIQYRLEAIAP